jgi:hypothetical protein
VLAAVCWHASLFFWTTLRSQQQDATQSAAGMWELLQLFSTCNPDQKYGAYSVLMFCIATASLAVCRQDPSRRLMVGLVGYPNVGKSSTINAIFGSKKTAVAPTPGKTKHFQTLNVSPTICLCDCPGRALAVSVSVCQRIGMCITVLPMACSLHVGVLLAAVQWLCQLGAS